MPTIFRRTDAELQPLASVPYEAEQELHDLIEAAPHLLPLSGAPEVTVLGREVSLATGFADLVAVEASGRVVIIEVKLASNSEARRAVVAQLLAYAAAVHRMTTDDFERALGAGLARRGHRSVKDAVASGDQGVGLDAEAFEIGLAGSLATGAFRLVFVLDAAPPELVRLAGYLEAVSEQLVIDLVTVSSYRIGGEQVIVPQRVDPGRAAAAPSQKRGTPSARPGAIPGADVFEERIERAATEHQAELRRLLGWARSLEAEGLVDLFSCVGVSGRSTLLPRFRDEKAGLVTIWNESGASVSLWRSVFERRAPDQIEAVEREAGVTIGQGNVVTHPTEEALATIAQAYRAGAKR